MKRRTASNITPSTLFLTPLIAVLILPATTLAAKHGFTRAGPMRSKLAYRSLAKRPIMLRKTVGWGPGEQMTFSARLGGIEAGRAAISVGKAPRRGSEITIRGRSESLLRSLFAMSEELVTSIDLTQMRPVRSLLKAERGKRITETRTQHRHGGLSEQHITRRENAQVRRKHRRRRLPAGHLDPLSALFLVRSLSWEAGQRVELHVVSGRKSYRVEIGVKGHARIRTPGHFADCLELRGVIRPVSDRGQRLRGKKSKVFTLWLSDDLARIPLKADLQSPWGKLGLELQSYRSSQRSITIVLPASLAKNAISGPQSVRRPLP